MKQRQVFANVCANPYIMPGRRKIMKNNVMRAAAASVLFGILFLFVLPVLAVSDDGQSVFVAGNPDLYPIEYYDSSLKQYCGLMPDIYDILSENTGYRFIYINEDGSNVQQRMAKNCQADIISAYFDGDIDSRYLKEPQFILTMNCEDGEKNVCIAFSDIASDQLVSDISRALNEINAERRLALLVSHTAQTGANQNYVTWIYILSGIVLLLLAIGMIIVVCVVKKHRFNQENNLIDSRYGIGNDKYYVYCFDSLISDKSKSLYYVAYIAFDEAGVNQQYGSDESKNIQRYVSEFLNTKTGAVEYLALVCEGVFAFLYQAPNKAEANERIRSIMDELEGYLCGFKREYTGLFCAGVCSLEENPGCTSETAFYNAKQGYLYALGGKIKYAFSTKNIIEQTHRNERLQKQIVQAIQNGEFQIYLQYIVDRNGGIFGAEAVSRWHHPREGLLLPSEYIKMMNQREIVTMHDFYIFEKVCGQLEEWKNSGHEDLCISCNFTRYSITNSDFFDRLKEILDRYEFRHGNLIIEITEDSLSYNTKTLYRNIEKCRDLGIRIALDDIGSGYSSLSDLYRYPIDCVKVERDIVLNSGTDRGKMLLHGLIQLSHSMKIQVLCEGVETPEQNQNVLDAGCDYIQGFYYSRVLPLSEAKKFLSGYNN